MTAARSTRSLALGLALGLCAAPATAQSVAGKVVDDATDQPIVGVQFRLLDATGRVLDDAVSDAEGQFLLVAGRNGTFTLSGTMIGYAAVRDDSLRLDLGERIVVDVRMAVQAVPLEAIVVTGRMTAVGDLASFYERMRHGRRAGFGHFISLPDIERSGAGAATDLLRMTPGIRVVSSRRGGGQLLRMSGNCTPAIFIDGMQINRSGMESLDDYVSVLSLEGIEVYRGATQQVGRFYDPRGCGLVLAWTRRGHREAGAFSWKKLLIGVGIIAAALFLLN